MRTNNTSCGRLRLNFSRALISTKFAYFWIGTIQVGRWPPAWIGTSIRAWSFREGTPNCKRRPPGQRTVAAPAHAISAPSPAIRNVREGRGPFPDRPQCRSFRGRRCQHPIRDAHCPFSVRGCDLNSGSVAFQCSGAGRLSGVHGSIDSSDLVHRFSTLLRSLLIRAGRHLLQPAVTKQPARSMPDTDIEKSLTITEGRLIDHFSAYQSWTEYFPAGYHFFRTAMPN